MRKGSSEKKYTLDRIEDIIYFFEYLNEENQLMVPVNKYSGELSEGDVVKMRKIDSEYMIGRLEEDTEVMRDKDSDLLEKLRNKK